jgi:NAD(P)H-flavin reductase
MAMATTSDQLSAEATLPRPHRVRRRWRETSDTVTIELEPIDNIRRGFVAGQFNMLYAFGVGEVPISISGDPAGGEILHTIRAVGPVTQRLYEAGRGDVMGVRGPYGTTWDLDTSDGDDVVVVAGGIGLPPLRPAIYQVLAERKRFGSVALLIGARSERDLVYLRQLEGWRSRFDLHVGVTVDHAGPAWRGRVGVVTDLISRASLRPEHTVAMVCGPEVMLRRSAEALGDLGMKRERIQVSLERNMKCAVGQCGRCQLAPVLLCRDGPVVTYDRAASLLAVREL